MRSKGNNIFHLLNCFILWVMMILELNAERNDELGVYLRDSNTPKKKFIQILNFGMALHHMYESD